VTPPNGYLASLFGLHGQVAIVTGGSGRLGSRYVRALADAGASVASFDLPGRASPALDQLIADHRTVTAHALDITDRAAVDAAIARVGKDFGTPTILVNKAGLGSSPADAALETGRFEQYPESAWDAMIDSHLKGALVASQSFIARFRAGGAQAGKLSGSIINISSTYGVVSPDQSVYDYRRKGGAEYFVSTGIGGNSQSSTGYVFVTDYVTDAAGKPVLEASGSPTPRFTPGLSQVWNFQATRGAKIDIKTSSLYAQDRWTVNHRLTLDLGTPRNRPETTIGAFGVAAVGTLPVQRWRFSGRLGLLSMDGRAESRTTRTAQGMLGLGVGFTMVRGLSIGLETAVSRVEFGAPIGDTTAVNWTALAATYRF